MTLLLSLIVWVGLAGAVADAGSEPGLQAAGPRLPMTVAEVWVREGGDRRRGDMTVTEDAIEFTGRKRTTVLPMEHVHFISIGKLKGDVDTEWVVLSVGVAPPYGIVGIKDGRKMGFGNRTRDLFEKLRDVARGLSAAQYRVPAGYRAYEDPAGECSLAIPQDWNEYLRSMVYLDGTPRGLTIFSREPIRRAGTGAEDRDRKITDPEVLERVLAGRTPAFFIERVEAERGASCNGISRGARKRVLQHAAGDALFGREYEIVEPLTSEPARIGGCHGLHVQGRSRSADNDEMQLDLYVAARGQTLFYFGLRAPVEGHREFSEPFEQAVAGVRFSAERP